MKNCVAADSGNRQRNCGFRNRQRKLCRCRFWKSAAKIALLLTNSEIGSENYVAANLEISSDGGVIYSIYIYIYIYSFGCLHFLYTLVYTLLNILYLFLSTC